MKKFKIIICSLVIFMILSGCKNSATDIVKNNGKFNIITSFYPVYIFALNIIKDAENVTLTNLTDNTGGCLHDYQLLPKDMAVIENGDVLLINGAGMEPFLSNVEGKSIDVCDTSSGVELISSGETQDDGRGQYNSHVYLSVKNAIIQVENICSFLSGKDEKNADIYYKNTENYIGKLKKISDEYVSNDFYGKEVVAYHDAFAYLAEENGFTVAAVITKDPEMTPSAKETANMINLINTKKIKVILAEEAYKSDILATISRETGGSVYMLDSFVSGNKEADAYEKVMKKNLEVLTEALK